MAQCKFCGKDFHACGSCDIQERWEWDYCSYGCADKQEQVIANTLAERLHLTTEEILDIVHEFRDAGLF